MENRTYGYARVSTCEQNIIIAKASGKDTEHEGIEAASGRMFSLVVRRHRYRRNGARSW